MDIRERIKEPDYYTDDMVKWLDDFTSKRQTTYLNIWDELRVEFPGLSHDQAFTVCWYYLMNHKVKLRTGKRI